MSQQLTPINGGVIPEVQTSIATVGLNVLSPQYIEAKNLRNRPTEWVPKGRPIYRRLPAISETYQIDFFNVVNESNILGNTFVNKDIEEVGYVYVPYGLSINGSVSTEVVSSDSKRDLLIKAGVIVWKYGKVEVLPTIVNLEVLDVLSGKYDIAYQLIYDDYPIPLLYEVSDFALTGLPLNITSSTDSIVGWRYPAENAFLNSSSLFWNNEDSYFPAYAQPAEAYLEWESDLTQAYKTLVLRCPAGTAYDCTATLSYVDGSTLVPISSTSITSDKEGQFFQFDIEEPNLQTKWNVTFSSNTVSIQSIVVSGALTLVKPQAGLSPRATLVMYPAGTLPATVINGAGEEISAAYCALAEVDIDANYTITRIQDTRSIIHRDYTPVADWLTTPFDENLIDLYEQVSTYSPLWMEPPTCMKQEYYELSDSQIQVEA
jgi:hypothetical protein